jgi:hypothetical protein
LRAQLRRPRHRKTITQEAALAPDSLCRPRKHIGREERYKLILRNHSDGPNEIYDLSKDPGETVDRFPDEHYFTIHRELADVIRPEPAGQ